MGFSLLLLSVVLEMYENEMKGVPVAGNSEVDDTTN
jgi:hypothetical protein